MTSYKYSDAAASIVWESDAQKEQFLINAEAVDDASVIEKMLSVMNKPSQFVGRVNDFNSAQLHWSQWDEWAAANEAPEEQDSTADPDVKRTRGRPATKDREAIAIASKKWHDAVAGRKQAKLDWAAFVKAETERLRQQADAALQDWDNYVAHTKAELSRLQDGY